MGYAPSTPDTVEPRARMGGVPFRTFSRRMPIRHALLASVALLPLLPVSARAQERQQEEEVLIADSVVTLPPAPVTRWAPGGRASLPFEFVLAGMRARVWAPGIVHSPALLPRREGTIVAMRGDTLLFDGARNRELVLVPRASIRTLDVSTGLGRTFGRARSGAILGAPLGFAVGSLLDTYVLQADRDCGSRGCAPTMRAMVGGTAAGMLVGAITGYLLPGHRWRTVRVD